MPTPTTTIPLANMTVAQAKASGQTDAYNALVNKIMPTPTSTPVTTTPTTTPVRTPGLLDTANSDAANAAASMASARQTAEAYAATQRQARIDAINTTFAPRIAREQKTGEDRLSRVAAINFKSGTVGSGVDTTKTGEQKDLNEKALQAIEDTKAVAINEAFGWADQLARQKAEDIYKDATTSAEAKVKLYQDRTDTALKALSTFSKAGNITSSKDLQTADPTTYQTLKDVSGMSDSEIDAYLKVNAPEGTYQWSAAQTHGSKLVVPKMVNGEVTMETLEMGFTPENVKDIDIQKSDSGIYIIDKKAGTWKIIPGSGNGGTSDEVLSVSDAKALGVPYGTTKSQAAKMSIIPSGTDPIVVQDLKDAQAAIAGGADSDAVRRAFMNDHPNQGDLFLKYTKQQY